MVSSGCIKREKPLSLQEWVPLRRRCPGLLRLMELWEEEEWEWAGLAGSGQG